MARSSAESGCNRHFIPLTIIHRVVKLEWYRPLGLSEISESAIRESFVSTLLSSNRDPGFFVDWVKVRSNVQTYEGPIALLDSIRTDPAPEEKLVEILLRTPAVAPILPILIAWRTNSWTVLESNIGSGLKTTVFDFSGKRPYSRFEAERIAKFCSDAGVLQVIRDSNDLRTFLLGVEVGMDTNARKNRSGSFMERQVDPHIKRACALRPNTQLFEQKKYSEVRSVGVEVPDGLLDRKFDYAIVNPTRRVSIEVNYYDKAGSKPQEIVDSYIERANELTQSKWDFVWVTDGPGWKGDTPQLRKAFHSMTAILNLDFCQRGVLEAILDVSTPPLLSELGRKNLSSNDDPVQRSLDGHPHG